MATIFRTPLIQRILRLSPQVATTSTTPGNSLINLLAGKDLFPDGAGDGLNYDWPNPKGRQFPISLRNFTQGLSIPALTAAAPIPFNNYDWPNPLSTSRFPVSNRTFLGYYVSDSNSPFVISDWPNPTLKTKGIENRGFLQPALTIGPNGTIPFTCTDWPNPRGRAFPSDLRTYLNPVETQLIGLDKFFAAPGMAPTYDYPNPRGKAFPSDLRTFIEPISLQARTAVNTKPFLQATWPNPAGYRQPSDVRFISDSGLALSQPGHGAGQGRMLLLGLG